MRKEPEQREPNHCSHKIACAKDDEVGVVLERVEGGEQSIDSLHR